MRSRSNLLIDAKLIIHLGDLVLLKLDKNTEFRSTSGVKNNTNNYNNREKFGPLFYILNNISKHKWRTFLTVMGIAIPIAFFIVFAAMGEGLEYYIELQTDELNKQSYLQISKIVVSWTEVLTVIIAIMIIISIANTMMISTAERKYEFGVLKALGISHEQILFLILFEALILSAIALIIGITIGLWSAILSDHMFWSDLGSRFIFAPAIISINSIIIATVLTLLIGTGTAMYPAIKAAKVNIIEILRYE